MKDLEKRFSVGFGQIRRCSVYYPYESLWVFTFDQRAPITAHMELESSVEKGLGARATTASAANTMTAATVWVFNLTI
jgi:hypothetical protein